MKFDIRNEANNMSTSDMKSQELQKLSTDSGLERRQNTDYKKTV